MGVEVLRADDNAATSLSVRLPATSPSNRSRSYMPRINKLTVALVFVFTFTVIASVRTMSGAGQDTARSGRGHVSSDEEEKKVKDRFPVVEYDAPEDADPDRRKERKEKGKRYDDYFFVRKDPSTEITESLFRTDWYRSAEALPVKESHKIVVGVVADSRAHLSNDKSGVYTEFVIEVKEVLKGEGGGAASGAKISADRPGGFVRYPGGYQRLYRFADMNAPAVGGEYVFFLRDPGASHNYGVITAYELT